MTEKEGVIMVTNTMGNTVTIGQSEFKTLIDDLVKANVELATIKEADKYREKYTSEQLAPLYEAFTKAQAEFKVPKKNRNVKVETKSGNNYTFNYADLSSIRDATVPALNKHGLTFRQQEIFDSGMVAIRSIITYKTGVHIEQIDAPLTYNAQDAQKARSITTYLRRYSMSNMLGVVAEDDDDNNIASGNDFAFVNNNENQHAPKQMQQGNMMSQGMPNQMQNRSTANQGNYNNQDTQNYTSKGNTSEEDNFPF